MTLQDRIINNFSDSIQAQQEALSYLPQSERSDSSPIVLSLLIDFCQVVSLDLPSHRRVGQDLYREPPQQKVH